MEPELVSLWHGRDGDRPPGLLAKTRAAAGHNASTPALYAAASRAGCGASNTFELAELGLMPVVLLAPAAMRRCGLRATPEAMEAAFRAHVAEVMAAGDDDERTKRWLLALATASSSSDPNAEPFATRAARALLNEAARAEDGLPTLLSPAAEGRLCWVPRSVYQELAPLLAPLYFALLTAAVQVHDLRCARGAARGGACAGGWGGLGAACLPAFGAAHALATSCLSADATARPLALPSLRPTQRDRVCD